MKIHNKTQYDGRRLRSIILAVSKTERRTRAGKVPYGWNNTVLSIYETGRRTTACCSTSHPEIYVNTTGSTVGQVAAAWRHVLLHMYGVGHDEMNSAQLYQHPNTYANLIATLGYDALTPKVKAPKPPKDPVVERAAQYDKLLDKEKMLRAKLRRVEAALKAVRKKKQRMEKPA